MYDPVKLQFYLEELKEEVKALKGVKRELTKVLKEKESIDTKIKALLQILKLDVEDEKEMLNLLDSEDLLLPLKEYLKGSIEQEISEPQYKPARVVRRRVKPETTIQQVELKEVLPRGTMVELLSGKYEGLIGRITSIQKKDDDEDDITYFIYVRKPDGILSRTSVKRSSYGRSWIIYEEKNSDDKTLDSESSEEGGEPLEEI